MLWWPRLPEFCNEGHYISCTGVIVLVSNWLSGWVSEVAQSCLTLCNPVDCSLPGSSIHGILQARILEWVAISFSRGSSQPRDRTLSPALEADALTSEAPEKPDISFLSGSECFGRCFQHSSSYKCLGAQFYFYIVT